MLSSLFFFDEAKLQLPQHLLGTVPSPLEQEIIKTYGLPQFVRYDVHSEYTPSQDLQQSRYAVWAGIATSEQKRLEEETQKEIGVYTTLNDFVSDPLRSALLELIRQTIKPTLTHDVPRKFYRHFREILSKAIQ